MKKIKNIVSKIEKLKISPVYLFLYFTSILFVRIFIEIIFVSGGPYHDKLSFQRFITAYTYFYAPLIAVSFFLSRFLKRKLKYVYNVSIFIWPVILIPITHAFLAEKKITLYYLYGSLQDIIFHSATIFRFHKDLWPLFYEHIIFMVLIFLYAIINGNKILKSIFAALVSYIILVLIGIMGMYIGGQEHFVVGSWVEVTTSFSFGLFYTFIQLILTFVLLYISFWGKLGGFLKKARYATLTPFILIAVVIGYFNNLFIFEYSLYLFIAILTWLALSMITSIKGNKNLVYFIYANIFMIANLLIMIFDEKNQK
jgi:hypothetical protein